MARALRVLVPGAWYHVVNRGIERRLIFHGEANYQKFEELLGLMVQQFGVRIHSYVLMPNHYHLQLETPRENLSEAIRWLNVSYAVWLNRKRGRVGPLFQRRFKAMVHDPEESGLKIQEYIHLNPVRVKRFGSSRSTGSQTNAFLDPLMLETSIGLIFHNSSSSVLSSTIGSDCSITRQSLIETTKKAEPLLIWKVQTK